MALGDRDFVEIVRLLPQTQIEVLNVACNDIHVESIVEFALQIPNLRTLKKARLRPNPWTEPDATSLVTLEERGTALVEGMMANYSMEDLDMAENLFIEDLGAFTGGPCDLEGFPECSLLRHYTTLNRAGRRILMSSSSIPLGLWPLVLERAGTTDIYVWYNRWVKQQLKANAVYYFLRHNPMICGITRRPIMKDAGRTNE